jgi:hypothetical protein
VSLSNPDKTKNINELADESGQNTPLTPMGADELGATAKSADMMGTPAQVKANIQMQEAAQEQRLKQQEQEAAAEEQRLAGQTLTQQQRYGQPSPTDQQKQAADIANTMRTLGPVQSRVQGLIQARLNAAQQMQASTIVDEEAIKEYLLSNDIKVGEQDAVALVQDVKNATDQDTYDIALQNLYNLLYPSVDGKVAAVPEGFETAVSGFFKDAQGAIEATVEPTITGGGSKIGALDLTGIGIDATAKENIARALGFLDANGKPDVTQLDNLTLEDLNAAIDAVEAQELGRVEELQNMLKDPTLTTSMRQAIYDELRQLGAAGVIGAEQDIVNLQTQIDEANVIELFGEEYTLEEALSDEGISDLIAKAAVDDDLLAEMKKDPKYQSLAQWVESNRQLVNSLLDEYEFQAVSFVDVQKNYATFRDSLGKDGQDVLRAIAEAVVPKIMADGKFKNSLTSSQYELFTTEIKKSALFSTVFDTETNKLKAEYSTFLTDLKKDPKLVQQFLIKDEEGNFLYKPQDIQNTVALKDALESENKYFKLLYGGLEGYASSEDYFGEGEKKGLALNEEGKLDTLTKWQSLKPAVTTATLTLQDAAEEAGKGVDKDGNPKPFLDIDDLVNVSSKSKPSEIMTDIENWVKQSHGLRKKLYDKNGNLKADILKSKLLGDAKFDYRDVQTLLKTATPAQKEIILGIFDANNDKKIDANEINNIDNNTYSRFLKYMGLGDLDDDGKLVDDDTFIDTLISENGDREFKEGVVSVGVGEFEYETDRLGAATEVYNTKWHEYDKARLEVADKYGYTSVDDGKNVAKETKTPIDNANSMLSNDRVGFTFDLVTSGDSWVVDEFNSLSGFEYKEGAFKGVKFWLPPKWEEVKQLASGNGFSAEEKKILEEIRSGGFSAGEFKNGKITMGNNPKKVKVFKKLIDKMRMVENTITEFLDRPVEGHPSKRQIDLKMGDRRLSETIERLRERYIWNRQSLEPIYNQLTSETLRNVDNFNKFSDEFTKAQNDIATYDSWFEAFDYSATTGKGKAGWNGKTYTFDQLLTEGINNKWVTA